MRMLCSLLAGGAALLALAPTASGEAPPPLPPFDLRASLYACFLGAKRTPEGYEAQISLVFYFHNRGAEPVVVSPRGYAFDLTEALALLQDETHLSPAFTLASGAVYKFEIKQRYRRRFLLEAKKRRLGPTAGQDRMTLTFEISDIYHPQSAKYVTWDIGHIDYEKQKAELPLKMIGAFDEGCYASHRLFYTEGAPVEPSLKDRPKDWEKAAGRVPR